MIDTHAHLTSGCYAGEEAAVLARAAGAGVAGTITVGTTVADSEAAVALAARHENVWATVGVHPHDAGKAAGDYLAQLQALAGQAKVCALGEMGLDYHYDFSPQEAQRRVLAEQLQLAAEVELPVVVHCREAFEECVAILDEHAGGLRGVVFHCFSGTPEQAAMVVARGWYLSFTGTLTFKNAAELREAARRTPLERIMVETDCPYLSPEPKRNVKPNEPALLVHTVAKLAEIKETTSWAAAEATAATSREFFGPTL